MLHTCEKGGRAGGGGPRFFFFFGAICITLEAGLPRSLVRFPLHSAHGIGTVEHVEMLLVFLIFFFNLFSVFLVFLFLIQGENFEFLIF